MPSTDARRLQTYQGRLQRLAAELAQTSFISAGSLVQRFMPCGKPGCRCQGEAPQLHGPYWQWSRNVRGKTVTRRLTEPQARLYQQWIANRRRLTRTITAMEQVSQLAGELLLRQQSTADHAGGGGRRARRGSRV